MFTRPLTLVLLMTCCGLARGAELPATWLLDLVTHETGWRFRQEFATWPGPYWRGPERPPVDATPDAPATWGLIRLAEAGEAVPTPQMAATELVAPLVEERPRLDGLLGTQEWSGAAQTIEPLEDGAALVLLTQHTTDTLYVCVAAPAVFALRRGQEASLYLAPADEAPAPLSPGMRRLRVRGDRLDRADLQSFRSEQGEWKQEQLDPAAPGAWRGAASGEGDGAWSFAVYEFAIPLAALGPANGAAGTPPKRWRFMARLQTVSGGEAVGASHRPGTEAVLWPDNRTSYQGGERAAVATRPDYWQSLWLKAGAPDDSIAVPVAKRPVRIDGQLGIKEWRDAYVADYHLPGDQWRRVWLTRDESKLYLAVRVRMARGPRQSETCRCYLDPAGDRGLLPRGDDLQFRLALGPDTTTETLRYGKDRWEVSARGEVEGASYPFSAYESTYELALPLAVLGPDLHPNIAVEVAYELEQ